MPSLPGPFPDFSGGAWGRVEVTSGNKIIMDNKSKRDIAYSLQLNVYTLSYETHVFGLRIPSWSLL